MKQMEGLKFRRQQPIDNYIVDFVCFENHIVIEVDGGQHATEKEKDIERDIYLRRQGFKVCLFGVAVRPIMDESKYSSA